MKKVKYTMSQHKELDFFFKLTFKCIILFIFIVLEEKQWKECGASVVRTLGEPWIGHNLFDITTIDNDDDS